MKVDVQRKTEEEDERDGARGEWIRHPFTAELRQSAERSARVQLDHLLAACSKSTDAEVRGQYQKYLEQKATQLLFERGGK